MQEEASLPASFLSGGGGSRERGRIMLIKIVWGVKVKQNTEIGNK